MKCRWVEQIDWDNQGQLDNPGQYQNTEGLGGTEPVENLDGFDVDNDESYNKY